MIHAAHAPSHDNDVYLAGPAFKVAGLQFTIPSRWQVVPADNPVRVGQWQIPAPHSDGLGGEAVAYFFGAKGGGSAKENIDGWINTMSNAEGHPASAEVTSRTAGGLKISQVVIYGTYNQPIPLPGVPPRAMPNFALVGVVVESPQGSIYWRFTGPDALVKADLPLFTKIIDTLKPQEK